MLYAGQVEKAEACYDYDAQDEDELTFVTGDVIEVIDKCPSADEGWWMGRLKGRAGLVPDNYFQIVPSKPVVRVVCADISNKNVKLHHFAFP